MGERVTPVALVVTAEPLGYYRGWHMHLNGHPIGYKPYDGSHAEEACAEVIATLAELVRERRGWTEEVPDDE